MRMLVCMVTNGQAADRPAREALTARVRDAARAGVDLVQVREPLLDSRALVDLSRGCVAAVRGCRARVVVNDRLDVALASGAHGVHLRADSVPGARLRRIVPPGFLIGRSVHSVEEASRAAGGGGLDYLVAGTVFPSTSKPGGPIMGVETLARIVRAVPLPVLAIGGVTGENLDLVAAAGAAGFAAITLFYPPPAPTRLDPGAVDGPGLSGDGRPPAAD